MNIKDTFGRIRGRFYLEALDKNGEIVHHIDDENLVVFSGRLNMARLLATANNDKKITKIAFGDGIETKDPELEYLSGDPYIKYLDDHEISTDDKSITFKWTLGFDEPTDRESMRITNYALYSQDEQMFAIEVKDSITKDNQISLRGAWTILM